MTSSFGVVDYEALRRLHQRATEAAQRANDNPDDDAADQIANAALDAYERGTTNYQNQPTRRLPSVTERMEGTEREVQRQGVAVRGHRTPPSEARLYEREGIAGVGGVVEGVARFPVDVARAAGRTLHGTIRRPAGPDTRAYEAAGGEVPKRAESIEQPGLGDMGRGLATMGYDLQSSLMEPDITGPERFGRIVGMVGNVGLLAAGRAGEIAKGRANARAMELSLRRAADSELAARETGSATRASERAQLAQQATEIGAGPKPQPAATVPRGTRAERVKSIVERRDAEGVVVSQPLRAEYNGIVARETRVAEETAAAADPLRQAVSEHGATRPEVVGAIAGGGLGAAIGATKGETPTERIKNALLLGGLGAVGGGYLARAPRVARTPALRLSEAEPAAPAVVERRIAAATPTDINVGALRPQDYVRAEKLGFTEPESVSRLHEAAGEAIQAAREHGTDWRVPVTWTQTAEAAERLGLRPNEILRRPAERLNTVELEALKLVAERADDRIATLARQLGDETLTAGQRLDIETAYERTWAEYRTVVSHFSKARTEAGRNLNILRKVANRPLDPLVWQGIAERVHRGPLTTAEMQQVRGLVAAGDRTALVRGVAALGPGRRMAQFVTLVKAGYLSKPSTHARNVGSNLANVAFRNVADVPATLLDAAIAPLTGQHTKSFAGFLSASQRGAVEGVGAARRALREGVSPETIEAWELRGYGEFNGPIARAYTETIFRGLDAEDQLFRKIAFGRALTEEAASLAQSTGLRGAARQVEMQRLLRTPTVEMEAVAAQAAEQAVYRQVTPLHTLIEGGKSALRRRGYGGAAAAAELVAPFTRTPSAVSATALNYSPVGVARAILLDLPRLVDATMKGESAAIRAAQRTFVERVSRGATGSAGLVLVGYKLHANGVMTGSYPTSPTEREQWRTEGKTSYAIRFRGRWWGMSGFAPFGTMLALGASWHEARQAEGEGESRKAERAVASAAGTLTEQPALQGIRRTAEALSDITGAGSRYGTQQVAGLVPGMVGGVAQAVDPVVRAPETMGQAVAARIPGLSQNVPARQDIFGQVVRRPEGPAGRTMRSLADPFASSRDRAVNDPLVAEMQRVGATVGALPHGKNETPDAYRERSARTGAMVRRELDALVASEVYRQATTEEQAKLIPKVVNDVRDDVRDGRNVHIRPMQALLAIRRAARREAASVP